MVLEPLPPLRFAAGGGETDALLPLVNQYGAVVEAVIVLAHALGDGCLMRIGSSANSACSVVS